MAFDFEKERARISGAPKVFMAKAMTLLISAFGLVAALAWNDAIQSLFAMVFGSRSELFAKFAYALIVTIVVTLVSLHIAEKSE